MLPPEILAIVYDFLDLPSLCQLAQSDTLAIPDSLFERKLKPLCPWFDPEFSLRNSYKECAIEFLRRQQEGAEFTPKWKKVSPDEFGPLQQQKRHVFYNFKEWDETSLQPEMVSTETLRAGGVYTSEYGVSVDLSLSDNWPKLMDDETESLIISHEDMVIIITVTPGLMESHSHLIIKFKDSPGLKPDVHNTGDVDYFTVEVLGPHVFLYEHHAEDDGYTWWTIRYLSRASGCRPILCSEKMRNPEKGEEGVPQPVFYDGLFYFTKYDDEGDALCVVQCWLEGDCLKSKEQDVATEYWLHDGWIKCTQLVFKGGCRYALVNEEFPYIYDLYRGLVVNLIKLMNSGVVDQSFISKMEDSGHYADDWNGPVVTNTVP